MTSGLVASGHPETTAAAVEVLRAGGNAFDAVLAAGFAATVAEPCLTSLGGGGFLLARTAAGGDVLFDFFVASPAGVAPGSGDMVPMPIRFDRAVQVFHAGPASVAVPGVLAGYLHVHERLGRLDLARVVAPAVRLARTGVVVNRFSAQLIALLEPILTLTAEGRARFAPVGPVLAEGDTFVDPDVAGFLQDVGEGAVAAVPVVGPVTEADRAAYRVVEREPLRLAYRDALVLTNPPPSFGGSLVAHGLSRLEAMGGARPADHAEQAVAVAETLVAMAQERVRFGSGTSRGTTHISVADTHGNLAALTTSNGSGSGVFAEGTGVQLNNMMGEDDLHPGGLGTATPGARIGSMMAPTMVLRDGRRPVAVGSGGSERIRSTLTQLVVDLVDHRLSLAASITKPRLHWDGERIQVEPGLPAAVLAALATRWDVNEWPAQDLYFGGAHGVALPDEAVGDHRRGGVGAVV